MNVSIADGINILVAFLGVVLLLVAFACMTKSHRRMSVGIVGVIVALVSVVLAIGSSLADTGSWDLLVAAASASVFGYGVYYFLQARASRRVASCIATESIAELLRTGPHRLRGANEHLRQEIERARNYPYSRRAVLAGLVPLLLVILIKLVEGP